jgi:uncharacterized damage-inducible protein DinB
MARSPSRERYRRISTIFVQTRVADQSESSRGTSRIEQGELKFDRSKPPHIERPKAIEARAPAFRVVHDEAVARVARIQSQDWAREIRYADGELWSIGNLLWRKLLMHAIHHRGQLTLLRRLAGATPPGLFGPTRVETPARRVPAPAR